MSSGAGDPAHPAHSARSAEGGWRLACVVGTDRVEAAAWAPQAGVRQLVQRREGRDAVQAALAALEALLSLLDGAPTPDHGDGRRPRVAQLELALPIVDELLARCDDEPVAMLLPRGFGDLLALGRQHRIDLYAPRPVLNTPPGLVPAALRFEVAGRLDAAGLEVEAVDEAEIDAVAARIAASGAGGMRGVRGVAVCSLFAHLNPQHERRIATRLAQRLPGRFIVASHEVDAQTREYERFLATALQARVAPGLEDALARLAQGLSRLHLPAPRLAAGDATSIAAEDLRARPLAGAEAVTAAALRAALAAWAARQPGAQGNAGARSGDALVLLADGARARLGLLRSGAVARRTGLACAGHELRIDAVDTVPAATRPPALLAEQVKAFAMAHGAEDVESVALVVLGDDAPALAAELAPWLGAATVFTAAADAAFVAAALAQGSAAPRLHALSLPPPPPSAPSTAPDRPNEETLDALQFALQGSADRMQALLMANARSTIAREAGDCAAALFLPDGRLLAQARSLPLLLGSLIPAVGAVLDRFPTRAMSDGDGYLLNDPWAGGTHLPDLTLVVPIVHDRRVVALAATSLHHQDVGGVAPGSVPPDATSIFDEGLRVPPVHSHRGGVLDPTLRALLRANTRTPEHLEADLDAQWRSTRLAARELAAGPLRRLGVAAFAPACAALLARAEALTRRALAAAPDGRWTWADQLDSDGVDDGPVPLHVALNKRGDALTIDFTGSAPQTRGPANASPAAMMAAALYFMRTLAPDAPNNAGGLAALTLHLPEGSVVNPRWPAAVNARTATVKLACNALLGAWGREAAAVTMAAHAGVAVVMSLGGSDAAGHAFFFTEIVASGAGASALGPGADAVSTDVGNARNTPVEVIEAMAPVRVEAYEIRRGSGGAGTHRGGDGVRRAYRLLAGRAQLSYRGERHFSRAAGCQGGEPGTASRATVHRADGRTEALGPRARVQLEAGDRWVIETAGGGGWGPAAAGVPAGPGPTAIPAGPCLGLAPTTDPAARP